MPPPKALAAPSSSREVVPVGPQHIQVKHGRPRRNELGQLPTTARALVLRNGKHGAMGAGEVFSEKFISAPEKLYWLGEDYRAKLEAGTTVMRPFDLDHAQRIADSQCNAYVDDILALKSPDTFYRDITEQVFAYLPSDEPGPSALKDRENVASAVMSRIHNLHMLASAWKIIRNRLEFLEREGLRNVTVKDQLLANEELRMEYLALYDMVAELETVLQTRLSLLSQASDHYSQYFRTLPVAEGDFAAFNWENLRPAYRSFIDHIVIELCLPNSKYQKYVLTTILSEALDELPKERRNFSKAMFDAVGDLRNAAELLEILDVPLLALRELGEQLKSQPRLVPEELKDWRAAQVHSEHVLNITVDKDLDIIFPLEQAKKKNVIDVLWRRIDSTCEENTDETFWELWMLDDVRTRIAYWGVSPSDIDNSRALIPGSKNTVGKNNKMMITNGYDSDGSHGSMPSLETASDSYEDEDEEDESEALTDEEIEDSNDEGSEYDSDVEEEFRFRHREAMDFASTNPDVFDHTKNVDEGFLSESDRKNNPFLKLLGSLRGRMFRTNPTLKTTKDEIPYQRTGVQPRSAPSRPAAAKATQTKTTTTGEGNRTVTVEEVEDEDEIEEKKKKKKKKKPKKKKPAATVASPHSLGAAATTPQSASSPPTSSPPGKATLTPAKPAPAPASAKKTEQASRNVLGNASRTSFSTLASESTTYLPAPQVAQSARSYLQEEGPKEKVKVKSRAPADLQPVEEKKGRLRNLISKFSRPSKPTKTEEAKEKSAMGQAFAKLSKKSTAAMAQILSTKDTTKHPPMRWDHFVKVMIEMGFHVDGSTAGSSVRFDPPDANTRSISFHKPHPEAHIEPVTLREWGKRLKETYGWSEDIFEKHRRA